MQASIPFPVTKQVLMPADIYQTNPNQFYAQIEKQLAYPFIAKPVDDGCSSAVIKIDDRKALEAYAAMMFRSASADNPAARETLGVGLKEEFPIKSEILFEQLIESNGAAHFLEHALFSRGTRAQRLGAHSEASMHYGVCRSAEITPGDRRRRPP